MENQGKMAKPTTIALFILIIAGLAFIVAGPLLGQYTAPMTADGTVHVNVEGGGGSYTTVTTTIHPCMITNVRVQQCGSLPCNVEVGDTVTYEITTQGNQCPSQVWTYIKTGATGQGWPNCIFKKDAWNPPFDNNEIEGMYGWAERYFNKYIFSYTIPYAGSECVGKSINYFSLVEIYENEWVDKLDAATNEIHDDDDYTFILAGECVPADNYWEVEDPECPSDQPYCFSGRCVECVGVAGAPGCPSSGYCSSKTFPEYYCAYCGNGIIEGHDDSHLGLPDEECEVDSDCGADGKCLDCRCWTACGTDADCPSGEWCRDDHRVKGICSVTHGTTYSNQFGTFQALADPGTGACECDEWGWYPLGEESENYGCDECHDAVCEDNDDPPDGGAESCRCVYDPNCEDTPPTETATEFNCGYPNPFSVGQTLEFSTQSSGRFDVVVYDVSGGYEEVLWNIPIIPDGEGGGVHSQIYKLWNPTDPPASQWLTAYMFFSPIGTSEGDVFPEGRGKPWESPYKVKQCDVIFFRP